MSTSPMATLLRHLRQWAAGRGDDPQCDRELLQRFARQRDEAAFAVLVRRHGPMVLSVCRRILHQPHDAEDAFQATFLVLLRKAGLPGWHDAIGGWLHGVATRIALRLRADIARRAAEVISVEENTAADPLEQLTVRELLAAFDEELANLSERYRAPLVLCHLQGKTQEETARQLGCSLSTIRRRLERGRKLLHTRLTRRGLELPAALGAVLLSKEASAMVPPLLRAAVVHAINGSVSARVAVLAESVLVAAVLTPMKATMAVVLLMGVMAAGAGLAASRYRTVQPEARDSANAPPPQAKNDKAERTDLYGDPLPPGALMRMGTVRFRHENAIGNVSYTPDGKILAAAAYGGNIRLYDSATGKMLRQFRAQARQYPAITFAPDGKTLAFIGTKIIQIWEVATGTEVHRFTVEASDANSYYSTIPFVFSSDGKLLASVSPDHCVHIWEAKSGKELAKLRGHQDTVCCLTFSTDGKTLFSASGSNIRAGSLRVWRVATGEGLRKHSLQQAGYRQAVGDVVQPTPLCFSPDGKILAVSAFDMLKRKHGKFTTVLQAHAVALFDVGTGEMRRRLPPQVGRLQAVSFSPDGKIVAAMNDEQVSGHATYAEEIHRIKGWETATGKQLFDFPAHCSSSLFWGGRGTRLTFTPDGKELAAASGSSLHIWNLRQGRERLEKSETHNSEVSCIVFSPDGRTLASASADHTTALWDVATGKQRRRLRGHEGAASTLTFSPDGKLLATASNDNEQTVRLWDAATGKELRRYDVPHVPIGGGSWMGVSTWVAFTPNSKILAAASTDQKLRLWDVSSGKVIHNQVARGMPIPPKLTPKTFPDWTHRVNHVAFTADGRRVAFSIGSATIHVVDVTAAQQLFQFKAVESSGTTALSPDGRTFLSTAGYLVEVASGKRLHELELPRTHGVARWAFSPDGRTLAAATRTAGEIDLFDVPTGKKLLRLQGDFRIHSLAFSPDGTKLASGQSDSTALIWDVSAARRKLDHKHLTPDDLERLWRELRDADAVKAHAALWTLAAAPDQAVPFLQEHLHPVPRISTDQLRRLIADLDKDDFARREKALHELMKLGIEAEPALRQVLQEKPSLEMRRRVEALLKDLVCQTAITADALRQLRAIQVLEQIGSAEARQILSSLSQGAPAAPATRDAAAALERLARRS